MLRAAAGCLGLLVWGVSVHIIPGGDAQQGTKNGPACIGQMTGHGLHRVLPTQGGELQTEGDTTATAVGQQSDQPQLTTLPHRQVADSQPSLGQWGARHRPAAGQAGVSGPKMWVDGIMGGLQVLPLHHGQGSKQGATVTPHGPVQGSQLLPYALGQAAPLRFSVGHVSVSSLGVDSNSNTWQGLAQTPKEQTMDLAIIVLMFSPCLVAFVACWPRVKASYLRTLK